MLKGLHAFPGGAQPAIQPPMTRSAVPCHRARIQPHLRTPEGVREFFDVQFGLKKRIVNVSRGAHPGMALCRKLTDENTPFPRNRC